MKKPLLIVSVIFALIVGFLVWWFSASQVIKRNTRELAETLTISAGDSKATRGFKGQDFAALLDADFVGSVDVENYQGDIGRDDAVSGHQYLGFSCQFTRAEVTEIEIINLEGNQAEVHAHFEMHVTTKGGSSYSDEADATLIWVRSKEDTWLLQSADLVRKTP